MPTSCSYWTLAALLAVCLTALGPTTASAQSGATTAKTKMAGGAVCCAITAIDAAAGQQTRVAYPPDVPIKETR